MKVEKTTVDGTRVFSSATKFEDEEMTKIYYDENGDRVEEYDGSRKDLAGEGRVIICDECGVDITDCDVKKHLRECGD